MKTNVSLEEPKKILAQTADHAQPPALRPAPTPKKVPPVLRGVILCVIGLVIYFIAAINQSETHRQVAIREGEAPAFPDETPTYVDETDRTAFAGKMQAEEFRAQLRTLAVRCRRSKHEVYRFVKAVYQNGGDSLQSAIDVAPAYCDRANQTDRDLIK